MEHIIEKIISFTLNNKKKILIIFALLLGLCAFLSTKVLVNYNMMDYLPEKSQSTIALDVMDREYSTNINICRVMLKKMSVTEALTYKEKLKLIDGVSDVLFLDDEIDITKPLEIYDDEIVEAWYKDNNAIITFAADADKQVSVINSIQDLVGDKGYLYGDVYNTVKIEQSVSKELVRIFLFVIPVVLIILLTSTDSWFEPILFLGVIGVAIILNNGTNIFVGEISFATRASSAILQLAVSMDYSIFLLHRFSECRKKEKNIENAMKKATVKSFVSILASGLTTVVGFAALLVMKFKLGSDMGLVMVKAIFFSLLCILFLLPILTVYSYKIIDKTKHKDYFPSFKKFAEVSTRFRNPLIIVFIFIIGISYLASNNISFNYGASKIFAENTPVENEKKEVEKVFGKSNLLILMVPKGDLVTELTLIEQLEKLPKINSVTSYATTVGLPIPEEYLPTDTLSLLLSDNYSRMVITTSYETEGKETFAAVTKIKNIVSKYYNNDYHLAGMSASITDMKEVVEEDSLRVNIIAIVFVGIILLFTFKSVLLSIILLLVIESSIWINLAFTYFGGVELSYFSYLIISSIQLGATIDYAILFTNRYLELRKKHDKKEASTLTIEKTFKSILISASILTTAGFILGVISTNMVISQLGILIGRGAIISTVLVIIVLPGLLVIFDKFFIKGDKKMKKIKSKKINKKQLNKIIKASLVIALVISLCTLGVTNSKASVKSTEKEENVYASLDSNGVTEGVYVVNTYELNEDSKICDYGEYFKLKNLTNKNKILASNDENCVDAKKGMFYYQGNIKKELPWNIEIKYFLNDKEIKTTSLGGKSGHLKISISITENRAVTNKYFDNYLLQITTTLSTKNSSNISAEGATIANVSNDKQIVFTSMPGSEKTYIIEADVTDFSMNGISINGAKFNFDLELGNINSLTNQVSDLENGIEQLYNGSNELTSYLNQLAGGSNELLSGANELLEGMSLLYSHSDELYDGTSRVMDILNQIKDVLDKYKVEYNLELVRDNISNLYDYAKELKQNINYDFDEEYITKLKTIIEEENFKTDYPEIYEEITKTIEEYNLKKQEFIDNNCYDKLLTKIEELLNKVNNLITLVQSIDELIKLNDGTMQYIEGYKLAYNGYLKLYDGISLSNYAITSIASGNNTFNNGMNLLYTSTNGMSNKVTSITDKFSGIMNSKDYIPESFVSNKNDDVKNVQFALLTKGIKKKEVKAVEKKEKEEKGFFGKIVALFN